MTPALEHYLYPALFIAGGILIGLFAEKVLLKIFCRLALRTRWQGDQVIVRSFRWIILAWGLLAGVYFGLHYLPLDEEVFRIVDQVIFSAFVISVVVLAGRLAAGLINIRSEDNNGAVRSTSIIVNIARISIYVIGVMVILQAFGVPITPMLTALGVGGLAVALALQDTLSNLFSGIQMIASKQVRTGDYIKLDTGDEGHVSDITWRNTTIRTTSNNLVVVPNAKVASAIFTNFYLPGREMSATVEVTVLNDSNLELVEQVALAAAKEAMQTEPALGEFEPTIRFTTFSDAGIKFNVNMRVTEFSNQFLLKHHLIKLLQKKFRENGIGIPSPAKAVYFKNEEEAETGKNSPAKP